MIIPPAPENRIAGVYPGGPRLAATSPDQRAERHENGILNLIREPLNLALLGLAVTRDPGHLTVTAVPGRQTAVPGAGNLPGSVPVICPARWRACCTAAAL